MAHRDEAVATRTPAGSLRRQPGAEPLPGYRLIEPLGSGGFGEVWKCEAPGGLFKAVKFVGADPSGGGLAAQERAAIERIKTIRHPFLLTLERVEDVGGTLVLVMELADRNLQSVLFDYQGRGGAGIPRGQLLRLLGEAAEALDVINFEHGLQHLDVKPHNLFVVSNHLKVADFGLVHRVSGLDVATSGDRRCGATPLYAAPETLQGSVSRHSDQYSLAIVYQQLLTGTIPFWSPNPYQLLMQHIAGRPDLSALPPADRPLVARALSKHPDQRFASCTDLIRALQEVAGPEQTAAAPSWPRAAGPSAAATRVLPEAAGAAPATVLLAEASPAAAADAALRLPQPTGLAFPGYRFLACVGRTALGCLWTVQAADGRERLAHCLLDVGAIAADRLARFEALAHAAVPARDVVRVPPAAVVIVADLGRQTLRDLFDHCRTEGLQGVPRPALLTYLGSAAEALDELARAEGLAHLGINPTQLVVDGDRLLLEDFGLASLLWAGPDRAAGPLNPRYAAPELSEPGGGPAADQYSLALIYTEMLTGIYPRSQPPGGKSGAHRRPALPDRGSGLHRRPTLPPGRLLAAAGAARVDLDFLPPYDRPVVARALHDDPARRYPSCAAFVAALRDATPAPAVSEERKATLRPVLPVACLAGPAPPGRPDAPTVGRLTMALIAAAAGRVEVREDASARYIVHPDGAWECRFPIRMFAGLLHLKLEGFRQQWDARAASAPAGEFAYEIVTNPGTRGAFRLRKPAGLAVRLRFRTADGPETNQREAIVRVGLFGSHGPRGPDLLAASVPRVFQSLKAYLQGSTEHRLRERWPFAQRVGVHPLSARLEMGQVLEARGRDVSLGGVRLWLPQEPPGEFAYLHFPDVPAIEPFAVLGRFVRGRPQDGGWEVGVAFAADGPPGV